MNNDQHKYGRLTVLRAAPPLRDKLGKAVRMLECVCDCGTARIVRAYKVRSGHTRSCGCLIKEQAASMRKSHGLSKTPTWFIWVGMVGRCYRPSETSYPRYGARGITVCEAWRSSYANFLRDMGERPQGKTLDRIDNDGNYEPSNCRWATPSEQAFNRRRRRPTILTTGGTPLTPGS